MDVQKNKKIADHIFQFIQNAAKERMNSLNSDFKYSASFVPFNHLMPGEQMGLILISNKNFRVLFKVFYDGSTVTGLLKKKQNMSEALVQDYIREYCNLTGGLIKLAFETAHIHSNISLPLVLMGFDDFFSPPPDQILSFEYPWILKSENYGPFYCSSFIEILDPNGLDDLLQLKPTDIQFKAGEVDFF